MSNTKLLFSFVFLSISCTVAAQNVKPEFKKFVYVTYRASSIDNKKIIRPEAIMEVNSDGIMHRFFNIYFDNSANLSFRGMLGGDTTYQVADSLISKLNKIFKDKSNLVQPREFKKSNKSGDYYGPYMFIQFTDNNGSTYELIIADLFDRNIEFRTILIKFLRERSNMNRGNETIVRDQQLEATILKFHINCKSLPQLQFRNLEIADPLIKH
jgi:hypothetical protein